MLEHAHVNKNTRHYQVAPEKQQTKKTRKQTILRTGSDMVLLSQTKHKQNIPEFNKQIQKLQT